MFLVGWSLKTTRPERLGELAETPHPAGADAANGDSEPSSDVPITRTSPIGIEGVDQFSAFLRQKRHLLTHRLKPLGGLSGGLARLVEVGKVLGNTQVSLALSPDSPTFPMGRRDEPRRHSRNLTQLLEVRNRREEHRLVDIIRVLSGQSISNGDAIDKACVLTNESIPSPCFALQTGVEYLAIAGGWVHRCIVSETQ